MARSPRIVPEDEQIPTIDRPPGREVLGEVERRLPVPLTDEEVRDRAAEVAVRVGQLGELRGLHARTEADEKAAKRARKAAEAEADRELSRLSATVRDRSEIRPVPCEEIADWSKRIVEISRIDTGAVVGTRPITDEDRQTSLARAERERQ